MNQTILKQTPLQQKHLELGAKMVPFAGWNMPVQYPAGILEEHRHTRTQVSIFDICHMGEFRISGNGAAVALDAIFPRPVLSQKPGSCRYNFLLTESGTVIDDLIIYRLAEEEFYIVVNAGTREGDATCLQERLPRDINFSDESETTAKIDLQGPGSAAILAGLGLIKEDLPRYYHWIQTELENIPVLLSRTGYTGELGFEFYHPADASEELWDLLLSQPEVKPAGLGARDTLRLEMGYPLYGHELDLATTPLEAGFGPMLKWDNGREFTGASALRSSSPQKQLVGIELDGRRAARAGTEIHASGEKIGEVCSGTFSPSLEKAIALAYITANVPAEPGMKLELAVSRTMILGQIAELPFYQDGSVRKEI